MLAERQESNKEFSKQIDYNCHAADLLSLVKVSGKSCCCAWRIWRWRPRESWVFPHFSGSCCQLRQGSPAASGHPSAHGSWAASSKGNPALAERQKAQTSTRPWGLGVGFMWPTAEGFKIDRGRDRWMRETPGSLRCQAICTRHIPFSLSRHPLNWLCVSGRVPGYILLKAACGLGFLK